MKKYILITGTNKGEKEQNLINANKLITNHIGKIISGSSIYESEPWGYKDSELYLNQVVIVESKLSPEKVLTEAKNIEIKMGRIKRQSGYEARIIDIDILFCEKQIIHLPDLDIPHSKIQYRKFVLEPLNELLPDFTHPALKVTINDLLNMCQDTLSVKKYKEVI